MTSNTPRETTLNLQETLLYVGWGVTRVSRPVCELSSVLSGGEQLYNNTETNACAEYMIIVRATGENSHSHRHDQ